MPAMVPLKSNKSSSRNVPAASAAKMTSAEEAGVKLQLRHVSDDGIAVAGNLTADRDVAAIGPDQSGIGDAHR